MPKLIKVLMRIGFIAVFLAGAAKIVSSFGAAKSLDELDPIFQISFRHLFWLVGFAEIAVSVIGLRNKSEEFAVGLLAFLVLSFSVYRFGLWWVDYHRPCSCMGLFMDAIGITRELGDSIMRGVLFYLVFACLAWFGANLAVKRRFKESRSVSLTN